MSRRLPVYLLIDTSGSMRGEPIQSVNVGLQAMVAALRTDPYALESVHICIVTFDSHIKVVVPLTPLESVQIPEIFTPESGATFMGKALELLCTLVDSEVVKTTPEAKGDWMPLLFLMTDGSPADLQLYHHNVAEVKRRDFGRVIACAAGPKAKEQYLKELTDDVVSLDQMDSASFRQFFDWISQVASSGGRSVGATAEVPLPPAPAAVQHVV